MAEARHVRGVPARKPRKATVRRCEGEQRPPQRSPDA